MGLKKQNKFSILKLCIELMICFMKSDGYMRCSIILFLSVVVSVLTCCSGTGQSPVVSSSIEELERRIAVKVEEKRKAAGLKPMAYHTGISTLARKHSDKLMKKFKKSGERVLSHKGFGGRSSKMILNYSMSRTAENVAYIWGPNDDPAGSFSMNWMNSPAHKENILKHWNYTGVGVAIDSGGTIYATQLFGLRTDFTFQ